MPHFIEKIDLAAARLGGAVLAANDEFFAEKENLLLPAPAVFIPDRYTDRGKWMDGWETRRRRTPGHDWCVVRLGLPGVVRGVDVDTSFFRGNYPEECALEACALEADPAPEAMDVAPWRELLPRSPLLGDTHNLFAMPSAASGAAEPRVTHLRLHIFPDGGVARLRAYGDVAADWARLGASGAPVDLAAVANGGLVLASSDMFFGSHQNLLMPGKSESMHDGWETKRRRGPGHDWVIIRLGTRGSVRRVEVDTSHFKGNYPDRCALELCDAEGASVEALTDARAPWKTLLAEAKLEAHRLHAFEAELAAVGPATHARFRIFPDGGVARLRLWGRPDAAAGHAGAPR